MTKFIKVAVSERLPKENGEWFHVFTEESTDICLFNGAFEAGNTTVGCEVTHWLEEVPDNESKTNLSNAILIEKLEKENGELVEMLESIDAEINYSICICKPVDLDHLEITELLNKVKPKQ